MVDTRQTNLITSPLIQWAILYFHCHLLSLFSLFLRLNYHHCVPLLLIHIIICIISISVINTSHCSPSQQPTCVPKTCLYCGSVSLQLAVIPLLVCRLLVMPLHGEQLPPLWLQHSSPLRKVNNKFSLTSEQNKSRIRRIYKIILLILKRHCSTSSSHSFQVHSLGPIQIRSSHPQELQQMDRVGEREKWNRLQVRSRRRLFRVHIVKFHVNSIIFHFSNIHSSTQCAMEITFILDIRQSIKSSRTDSRGDCHSNGKHTLLEAPWEEYSQQLL